MATVPAGLVLQYPGHFDEKLDHVVDAMFDVKLGKT
jgi:hypothetical protein